MARSVQSLFHEFAANATADVAMSLLRSPNALQYMALMAVHLGDGRIVDGPSLAAAVSEDLVDLPGMVNEDEPEEDLDAAAQLLRRWTKKGWVHRSLDPETRIERYQLTSGADQAVRQIRQLRRHNSIATESTLALVMAELRQIAAAANPDPQARRSAITEQIDALTAQLELLDSGEAEQAGARELIDKVAALVQLVDRIPADVARYGEAMHANTAALLRQSLSEDSGQFADLLSRMFEGHDVISDSPEGQAFRAFANLVGTPSQRVRLETDIDEILTHIESLPPHLAESLAGFIDTTMQRVTDVEAVRALAFRRMSNFVRGGDAAHYRSMHTRVAEAQAAAADAFKATHPGRDIGFAVPMSGVATSSVGQLRLDEGTATAPEPVTDTQDEFEIDATALAGAESIDWEALRSAVNEALAARGDYATLPDVLELVPEARTGDVLGIWSLANRYGEVDDEAREAVTVHTRRGPRELTLPSLLSSEPVPGPARPAEPHRDLSPQSALF
jgi:hypothetical protein